MSAKATPACSTASRAVRAISVSRSSSSSLPKREWAKPMIAAMAGPLLDSSQIPFEIALRWLGAEPVGLDLLDRREDLDEILAEILLQHRGAPERIDRVIPVARNVASPPLIAIAGDRLTGIELLGDAMVDPGQHCGKHQIGI